MKAPTQETQTENFSFSSSIAADVWHPKKDGAAYEWWYFDALSDDGKEAIVIIFLDNFIFSPRYNKREQAESGSSYVKSFTQRVRQTLFNPKSKIQSPNSRFPAVAFVYYRDGKPVYRAINEFSEKDFEASIEKPDCTIGDCSFKYETAPYGSGYLISINAVLSRDRKLEAHFEWLSIEADFAAEKCTPGESSHCWNMVAPRSDVSGRISVSDKNGESIDARSFRGTGYHDHNLDNRWLPETVNDWHWGRVHFADSTAVFYRYCETNYNPATTKLLVISDGVLRERDASYTESGFSRDKFGIRYPTEMSFASDDSLRLYVKHQKIIDSSFFYLRFLSEMTLKMGGGKSKATLGITEYLAPKALKFQWLNWLINMRIGRDGKGSFLP
ncbi:MAG TPA: hypothetical protein VF556_19065 [Pyrinomonadaceae bacterium]|jgi:carotenoid 1,2-hydratase